MAAAACAENAKAPSPPELELAQQCERFRALPYAGGVLDQPAGLLDRMQRALAAYTAMRSYAREGMEPGAFVSWANAHPDWNTTVNAIKKLRRKHG